MNIGKTRGKSLFFPAICFLVLNTSTSFAEVNPRAVTNAPKQTAAQCNVLNNKETLTRAKVNRLVGQILKSTLSEKALGKLSTRLVELSKKLTVSHFDRLKLHCAPPTVMRPALTISSATNILKNSGFESQGDWYGIGAPGIKIDSSISHSNIHSLKISSHPTHYRKVTQNIGTIADNKDFYSAIWVKGAPLFASIWWYDHPVSQAQTGVNHLIRIDQLMINQDRSEAEWKLYETFFTTSETLFGKIVLLAPPGSSGNQVYVDDAWASIGVPVAPSSGDDSTPTPTPTSTTVPSTPPTAFPTTTSTSTPIASNTPQSTGTPTLTPTRTPTRTATRTITAISTATLVVPTATRTATPTVSLTATRTSTPTATRSATPTRTPLPGNPTMTPTPLSQPTSTPPSTPTTATTPTMTSTPTMTQTPFVSGQNLILNPSFAEGMTNWSSPNSNLDVYTLSSGGHPPLSNGYLNLYTSGAYGGNFWGEQYVNSIAAGYTYDISGWIKTNGIQQAAIVVFWRRSDGTYIAQQGDLVGQIITGTTDWVQQSLSITAPSGAVQAQVRLFATIANPPSLFGSASFDDISLSSPNAPPPATPTPSTPLDPTQVRPIVPTSLATNCDYSVLPAAPAPNTWIPPMGIPAPSFGITQQAPARPNPWNANTANFYYVDQNASGCTNSGNGYPGQPRCSIPQTLPAGAVLELHGSYDPGSEVLLTAQGTASNPVYLRGQSDTQMGIITAKLRLSGSYLIVENIKFMAQPGGGDQDTGKINIYSDENGFGPAHHIAIRHCDVAGKNTPLGTGGVVLTGDDIVLYHSVVHDSGYYQSNIDADDGGVFIDAGGSGTHRVWVLDTIMCRNGRGLTANPGFYNDGSVGNSLITHVYVGRNIGYQNRETNFWSKHASDVIFSSNVSIDPVDNRPGNVPNGMGFQYAPERVWFLFNEIYNVNGNGITLQSNSVNNPGQNTYMIGNKISVTNSLLLRGGQTIRMVNNSVFNVNAPEAGNSNTYIMSNNIYNNISTNDSSRFQLTNNTGPIIDGGIIDPVYDTFQQLYGIDIRRDFYGVSRPQGAAFDRGAIESVP